MNLEKYFHNKLLTKELNYLLIILSISGIISYIYFRNIQYPNYFDRFALHESIVNLSASYPYRQRLLVPFLSKYLMNLYGIVLPQKLAFLGSYLTYSFFSIFLFLTTLYIWIRNFFKENYSIAGVLVIALLMQIALDDHYFQPWSLIDAFFFTLSFILIKQKNFPWLFLINLLANLNRETGIFIPIAFATSSLYLTNKNHFLPRITKENFVKFSLLFGSAIIVYFSIRLSIGVGELTAADLGARVLLKNIELFSIFKTSLHLLLLSPILIIYPIKGFSSAPQIVKKISLFIPFYLISYLIFGVWYEIRILIPLCPILIVFGLSFFFKKSLIEN